jgi:cytoskeleton protein RodZ
MALARARVSLFQRIKTPFGDSAENDSDQPERRAHAVGALLRARREELGLDIAAIGEALRIKPAFLSALEQGRTQDLPGATYAIGFVRAYAHYLGFDSERVLEVYKAESADVHAKPDLSLPVPLGARSLPGGPILLVGVILALCGYGTWYYLATGERNRPERVAAVPAELQQLARLAVGSAPADTTLGSGNPGSAGPAGPPRLASGLVAPDTAQPQASEVVATPAGVALPPAPVPAVNQPTGDTVTGQASTMAATAMADTGKAGGTSAAKPAGDAATKPIGQVDIKAVADCWIQVRGADQSIVFSRVLKAGETYQVPRPGLILRTGNAGALAIMVDGKPAPAIGAVGTLRRNVSLEPEALLAGTAVKG